MKIENDATKVTIDEMCNLEVALMYPSLDNRTTGHPNVYLIINTKGENEEWDATYTPLSPKKAIQLAKLLRNIGKEAYAQRIEED